MALKGSAIAVKGNILETVTLSIKTDAETKNLIKAAADRLGLSTSAFVIMVSKQAALSSKIVLNNYDNTFASVQRDIANGDINEFASWQDAEQHLDA